MSRDKRIIKFRAWDDKEGMLLPEELFGDVKGELLISLSGEVYYCYEENNGNYCPSSLQVKRKLGLIIMQFTGLKDVNKADVYEADYFDTEDGLMEVFFIDGKFILMWADTGTYRCDLHECVHTLSKCGNKFENPELINQTK